VVEVLNTGLIVSATAVVRAGAVSLDADVAGAWLGRPLEGSEARLEMPEYMGTVDLPAVVLLRVPVHFDLAPGEVGLLSIRRGAGPRWVLLVTARAPDA
jgi:hypothetical protein